MWLLALVAGMTRLPAGLVFSARVPGDGGVMQRPGETITHTIIGSAGTGSGNHTRHLQPAPHRTQYSAQLDNTNMRLGNTLTFWHN